jgi:hypothetical protein
MRVRRRSQGRRSVARAETRDGSVHGSSGLILCLAHAARRATASIDITTVKHAEAHECDECGTISDECGTISEVLNDTLQSMTLKPASRKRANCDSWDQRHVTTASA